MCAGSSTPGGSAECVAGVPAVFVMEAPFLNMASGGLLFARLGIDASKSVRANDLEELSAGAWNALATPFTDRWRPHLAQMRYGCRTAEAVDDLGIGMVLGAGLGHARIIGAPIAMAQ